MDNFEVFIIAAFAAMCGTVIGSLLTGQILKPKRDPNTGRFIKG